MRNSEMAKLSGLVGEWTATISDAFFLEPPGTEVPGTTIIEWLGESLLVARSEFGGGCREFAMTFDGGHWTMIREDPDFHQRFIADVEKDRIAGRWEASEDGGKSWRKDFDLTFERA
jgi:hypothetical protein